MVSAWPCVRPRVARIAVPQLPLEDSKEQARLKRPEYQAIPLIGLVGTSRTTSGRLPKWKVLHEAETRVGPARPLISARRSPVLDGRGTITRSPSRCFRISTLARWGSRRSNSSSHASLDATSRGRNWAAMAVKA